MDTPANGLQVLGRNDNMWDQGALFVSQNTSYLSPCGMAQIILNKSYATDVVAVLVDGGQEWWEPDGLDVIAARDPGSSMLTVRAVNKGPTSVAARVSIEGCSTETLSHRHFFHSRTQCWECHVPLP